MTKFVDMAKSPQEMAEGYGAPTIASPSQSIYPYGLCISLCEEELEKLGLDDDCEVDDVLDMRALAKVTSVSKNQTTDGIRVRVELQITMMAVENESDEDEDDEGEEPVRKVKNPYK